MKNKNAVALGKLGGNKTKARGLDYYRNLQKLSTEAKMAKKRVMQFDTLEAILPTQKDQ